VNVLVIDDDAQFAQDLAEAWPNGSEVVVEYAGSSIEALEMIRSRVPEAIVLDLTMPAWLAAEPSREGLALLGALVAGSMGQLPIIVATESDDRELTLWCHRLGARDVFTKSGGLDPIYEALADALEEVKQRTRKR